MEKRTYLHPETRFRETKINVMMTTASPGVGDDYDPSRPIESKNRGFYDEPDDDDDSFWSK